MKTIHQLQILKVCLMAASTIGLFATGDMNFVYLTFGNYAAVTAVQFYLKSK